MILIADSGATKADWRFIDRNGNITAFSTAGLSPLFWTSREMTAEIIKKFPKKVFTQINEDRSRIYFYGTSCSSSARIKIVQVALKKAFPRSKAVINHDILASARALLGREKGIACILGTGSNSCYYDGKKIIKIIGGLTYILGDEGSGAHIGLNFIKAFLNHDLPPKVHANFLREYHLTKDEIFDAVYNKKYPNRFLASFAKFVHEQMGDPFVASLVKKCISEFFEKSICKYNNYTRVPVGFVGSIAGHFDNVVRKVAREKGVIISKIISSPIDELVKYHLKSS